MPATESCAHSDDANLSMVRASSQFATAGLLGRPAPALPSNQIASLACPTHTNSRPQVVSFELSSLIPKVAV
jgi:hypothetical protein